MPARHGFNVMAEGLYGVTPVDTKFFRQGQRPETLFITRSDSRVLAELTTQSQPENQG